jgi:predicted dehydrogenase/nucleoside-diphosphate-sugar epimerase
LETRIKVGLLGAGYILDSHAKALRAISSVEVFAVCDISKARAEQAAQSYKIPNVFTSVDELIQSPVDVVHVLLPPHLHEATAEKLLAAGKHVFLEKPMGLSSELCAKLVALAKTKGVTLAVNHNFLFTPAYDALRTAIKAGECGTLDYVSVNWLYPLGMLQLGPFNNWMLQQPENLMLELTPHAAAFALDLLGPLDTLTCQASDPIDLPGHQRVVRHWTIVGTKGRSTVVINASVNPGQPDRSLMVRGSSAVAKLDYERGVGWIEKAKTNSAIFDGLAKTIRKQSRANFATFMGSALKKSPDTNVFLESIHRTIAAFYATFQTGLDPRLEGSFGVEVIRLIENAAQSAGVTPYVKPAPVPTPPQAGQPHTMVIGGTGFIGKRLVAQLVADGKKVRVLTRSRKSAALEFEGLALDIAEGRHDDQAVLDKILPGIQTVYHLAKAVGEKWSDYVEADVKPTEVLARACVKHKVGRFIYTGTIDSYHSSDPQAVITGDTPVDTKIKRRNHYARSKATCEALLTKLHKEEGLPLVILRPGIVIGRGSPPAHWGVGMFLSDTLVKFWGKGDNALPLVLVDDVAQALVLAAKKPGIEGKSFLLTDKPLLTAQEYVGLVQKFSGTQIRQVPVSILSYFLEDLLKEAVKNAIRHPNRKVPSYRDWGCRAHVSRYDASATIEQLGWKPAGDKQAVIDQGIKAAVEYYYR